MNDTASSMTRRMNRAIGAKSHAEWAEAQAEQAPKRLIPTEFNAEYFDSRVGVNSDDAQDAILQRARRAYETYGAKLRNWAEREATIHSDPYEQRNKKRMTVAKMVKDELERNTEVITAAHHDLRHGIETIDSKINHAFRHKMKADDAREVRQHVKNMSSRERAKFLADADDETVASVLAAKPFLSGLKDAEAAMLRHKTVQRLFPDEMRRRAKYEKAFAEMDAAYDRYQRTLAGFLDPELSLYEATKAKVEKAVSGE